jgi:CheY-like chemotaxis protein
VREAWGKGTRVLVVEDDIEMRQRILRVLRNHGYQAVGVADGAQALAHLQHGSFDAVVTDIYMIRVHGLDLLREVRRMGGFPPVTVYTGALDSSPDAWLHPKRVFCVQMRGGSMRELLRALDEAGRAFQPLRARCA